jgi:hypothetical protein
VNLRLIALIAASVSGAAPGAQLPARIDFQRDLQPIFLQHCISCHGSDQQMNGLRLDRRADARRGGSQTDIGPGNAQGSRLYHRLVGTTFGLQMPPPLLSTPAKSRRSNNGSMKGRSGLTKSLKMLRRPRPTRTPLVSWR